ncbi:MAG: putative Peptidoglycan domain protein [Acidobacteria bacterium ADurb.Bin051]|nr:MAG: putative Peptidoglycan domain protein [Acidobacteria bacterium ADurb.Bin051]
MTPPGELVDAFEAALRRTLAWEGAYADDPADPGGETVLGIARRRHAAWLGWRRVDEHRRAAGGDLAAFRRALAGDPELRRMAAAFYASEFWRPIRAEDFAPEVAAKLFDTSVNVGRRRAVELLQWALGAGGFVVAVDGRVGSETIAAAAEVGPRLLELQRAAQAGYYVGLIAGRPELARFRNGWGRRALA